MKRRNSRYGCPRIAQQINLAFGLDLDKDTVRRVLAIHYNVADMSQYRWEKHCRGLFQLPVAA